MTPITPEQKSVLGAALSARKMSARNTAGGLSIERLENVTPDEVVRIRYLLSSGAVGFVNDYQGDFVGARYPAHKAVLVQAGTGYVVTDALAKPISGPPRMYPPVVFPVQLMVDFLKQDGVEGYVPHMYADTRGNITVGAGLNLEANPWLLGLGGDIRGPALQFVLADDPENPLTDEEATTAIDADQVAVRAHYTAAPNSAADTYGPVTSLRVTQHSADRAEAFLINEAVRHLMGAQNSRYPEAERYPVSAQMGLVDLIFNVGRTAFKGYEKTRLASLYRDWRQVGVEQRDGRNSTRADKVQQLFNAAAAEDPFFIAFSGASIPLAKVSSR